jgi:MPBQ/MSBQ methyltransferase
LHALYCIFQTNRHIQFLLCFINAVTVSHIAYTLLPGSYYTVDILRFYFDSSQTLVAGIPLSLKIPNGNMWLYIVSIFLAISIWYICKIFFIWISTPSRPYKSTGTVSASYDNWTEDGILEFYWGEHIHLGFYSEADIWCTADRSLVGCFIRSLFSSKSSGYRFLRAKENFTKQMLKFSGLEPSENALEILDVGCGIGGSSRILARCYPKGFVTGISVSRAQICRAKWLSLKQNVQNVNFKVEDGTNLSYTDNQFDVVWMCESSEHVEDKEKFLSEARRVLKPGGVLVIAAWCSVTEARENTKDAKLLEFLEQEWSHPRFACISEIGRILSDRLKMSNIAIEDWTYVTLPSWRHSIFVGVWNPIPVFLRPSKWLAVIREIYTIEAMHTAFSKGVMQYGLFKATK